MTFTHNPVMMPDGRFHDLSELIRPERHDLDPDAMTETERLGKRRAQAWFAFEVGVTGTAS